HLLVDGRGVPLSIIVTGANEHDVSKIDQVLESIVIKRKAPPKRRSKHLCADAGYRGKPAAKIIAQHGYIAHVVDRNPKKPGRFLMVGYIAHVVDRSKEADNKRRDPKKKARRWVVEVCHSWFNRFRKLLVRYEKLERSFLALNHLAAAIIAFRKVPLRVNIIYG
ncbi:MAG: IS5 family transposase, partial [Aquabacterium sp.]|uniref:IS5 family transposase n=1 Tax=Aquabacterium sp. TaxID=1872578 RepID=UPI003BB0D2DB